MATYTTHYSLPKPAGTDNYDISQYGGTMDTIDTALYGLETSKQPTASSLQAESSLEDRDSFPFYDASAEDNRKTTFGNIKSSLKTYFDSLYSIKTATVTIATSDWSPGIGGASCNKPVTGVTANNIVILEISDPLVSCTGQGNGLLFFTAIEIPSSTVTVKVVILG